MALINRFRSSKTGVECVFRRKINQKQR